MNIIKLTDNFYHLVDVFDDTLLQKIHTCFQDKTRFSKLFQGDYYRLESGDFDQAVRTAILEHLQPAQQFAESILGKLYTNNTQLWEDFDGYVNAMHKDASVNLTANIQVYVLPGDESMGTSIIENEIVTSVPYKYNCGYLLLQPTKIEHGMTSAVVDRRMSVYQSYRSTLDVINEW
tara:strand:+ start:656 stop:1186 length:531 start_codon:yes stop_codon:yes gene_type:complete